MPDERPMRASLACVGADSVVALPGQRRSSGDAVEFNLAQVFTAVAAANPDRDCIVFGDRRLTFAQTDQRARRFARVLHDWGLGARRERAHLAPYESGQSHLGLYMANCNEFPRR